ncbi:hypothetical protein CBW16_11615 [Flavobacteriaceae bacterium JJC]|nr:hypothetical protein CBW16_11615 [Flavobacteriaceae bacterium JJC]
MLAAALLTAGITMSYKVAEKKANDTAYFYNSDDMSEGAFHNVSNWTTSTSAGIGCVTSGVRPCKVIVPENSSLSDVLGSKDNEEVLDISVNRKSAP